MANYILRIDSTILPGNKIKATYRSISDVSYNILISNIRKDRINYIMGIHSTRGRIDILLQDFKSNKEWLKMSLMDIIKKIGNKEEEIEYIPKVVVDKQLDGLRRLKQVQDNETEKVRLKKVIADFNRERTARHMFGIKDKKELLEKKRNILSKIETQNKVNILKQKKSLLSSSSLLNNRKDDLPKKEVNILNNHSSFLR